MTNFNYNLQMVFNYNKVLEDMKVYMNRRTAGARIERKETEELAEDIVTLEKDYADPWEADEIDATADVIRYLETEPETYYNAMLEVLFEVIGNLNYEWNTKENDNND
jgi:hypothetical protein